MKHSPDGIYCVNWNLVRRAIAGDIHEYVAPSLLEDVLDCVMTCLNDYDCVGTEEAAE